ncbi:PEP-CTERM protein-sorting domain-containing protein [Terrimicrobium sacchariphilum]|uniref:PEP-CTERM protein-sorting domain-containing protein n=2 Tax=Terrimicrobium sacchariphilum TaxID=690879 RepID=A0A146G696_TERSA|nr:PEP-CTERM protein-sorting domain-containing protein [Terrimicrobium sacchariphilum]
MDRNTLPLTKMLAMDKRLLRIAMASCLVMASAALTQAANWVGAGPSPSPSPTPPVYWSAVYDGSTTTTGWDSAAPNSNGASANFTSVGAERATTLDAAYTVGSLTLSGTSSGARRINFTGSEGTNTLTFNSGDTGPATITNNASGNSIFIYMDARVNLDDDLVVTNNNAVYTTNPGIRFNRVLTGNGNLTFVNVNNSLAGGQISLTYAGSSTFTGNVLVKKGAVVFGSTANAFGATSNIITLGSAGEGSASLVGTASGSASTLANNIVVASGTGGTLLLGNSGSNSAVNATFTGTITLNGDVSLISNKPSGGDVRYTNVISGVGSVTTVGSGETQFGNGVTDITNTYRGNTTLADSSSLVLSDNTQMTFYIGNSGVNNKITATGFQNVLTLDGDFVFDLTGAAANGTWQIVDVNLLNETFSSSFRVLSTSSVNPWAENNNVWTYVNGGVTYSFSEATGVLTAVPEPTTALLLGGGLMVLLLRRRRRS